MLRAANSNIKPERPEVQRMMRSLVSFAHELGLNDAVTRLIVESTVNDMPMRSDEERLVEALAWIVAASAKR